MVVRIVRRVLRDGVLGEGTLSDVNPHAAQIQRGVCSACLHPRATTAAGHIATSATAAYQFLVELIVKGTAVPVAVQRVVQPGWIQVVIWILEREQTVLWNTEAGVLVRMICGFRITLRRYYGSLKSTVYSSRRKLVTRYSM